MILEVNFRSSEGERNWRLYWDLGLFGSFICISLLIIIIFILFFIHRKPSNGGKFSNTGAIQNFIFQLENEIHTTFSTTHSTERSFSANYKFSHCGPHFTQLTKHAQLTQLSRKSHCSVLAPSAFSLDSLFLRRLSPASSPVAHASHLALFFTARVSYIDLFQYCCKAAERRDVEC